MFDDIIFINTIKNQCILGGPVGHNMYSNTCTSCHFDVLVFYLIKILLLFPIQINKKNIFLIQNEKGFKG
jgi:hypothetical protein